MLAPLICCFANLCAAADTGLGRCPDAQDEYQARVERLARDVFPGALEFWAVVLPSFEPESMVAVSSGGGQHRLTHAIFHGSVWARSWVSNGHGEMRLDVTRTHVRVTGSTSLISDELYSALQLTWANALDDVQSADPFGLDGTSYNFRLPGKCRSASAPSESARVSALVELVNRLVRLADQKRPSISAGQEEILLRHIRELPPGQN